MAELPASLPCNWGTLKAGSLSEVRSYDGTGNCFSFIPTHAGGWNYAIDVEPKWIEAPENIQSVLGPRSLEHWLEIELVAKLTDTPAHTLLQRFISSDRESFTCKYGVEIARCDTSHHWMAVGRRKSTIP